MRKSIPQTGTSWDDLKTQMKEIAKDDMNWRLGKTGMYVFYAGDDVLQVAKEAYTMFMSENALGPMAFPSLKRMEEDVVGMGLSLLNAPDGATGNMTSGGSESIFLAVKSARDRAASRGMDTVDAEVLVPHSAHLAFDKACHNLRLKIVRAPLAADYRADVNAIRERITDRTIMMVGSAPCYPFGLIDPITELAAIAKSNDIWFHVDACVGGYFAPFAKMNGVDVEPFDFSIDGVCTISADVHKYGYAAKGASTILHASKDLHANQIFDCDTWPSGRMVTPTMAGTRPGGAIAAAWAVMQYLGVEGYCRNARIVTETRQKLADAVASMDGFHVHGDPKLGLIAFGVKDLNIFSVYGKMMEKGWFTSVTSDPKGIHLMVTPAHGPVMKQYIEDLKKSAREVASGDAGETREARYGG
jgi:glutamate/tyrosine decarboxylase-like PLP-dependent enzyme